MTERVISASGLLGETRWRTLSGNSPPAVLSESLVAHKAPQAPATLDELKLLVDAYEIDVHCSQCTTTIRKPIGWLRTRHVMCCSACNSIIVLRTSLMMEEIRRVGRLMRELQSQLLETVGRVNSMLRR
jgi:hypothetical protein